jgi:predicted molibdopterin-dependent oxidoreductase YjgC
MSNRAIGFLTVNGKKVAILEGDTIGACLMRAGILTFRKSYIGEPRGIFCSIGICHGCLVMVDGVPNVPACITKAEPGAVICINGAGK